MRAEDGQALVELALVLPILLILIFGIVDFGRAANYWNGENSLANVAARYAAVGTLPTSGTCGSPGGSNPLVTFINCEETGPYAIASTSAGTNGLNENPPCVYVPSNTPGQPVTVEVDGSYTWLPLPSLLSGSHANFTAALLTGTATMRLENPIPSSWITTTTGC